jgi:hypothetical protein
VLGRYHTKRSYVRAAFPLTVSVHCRALPRQFDSYEYRHGQARYPRGPGQLIRGRRAAPHRLHANEALHGQQRGDRYLFGLAPRGHPSALGREVARLFSSQGDSQSTLTQPPCAELREVRPVSFVGETSSPGRARKASRCWRVMIHRRPTFEEGQIACSHLVVEQVSR